jgi:uncharacterized protein involved in type VI secretion and phage assembly
MSMTTERILADLVARVESRFYGKYRGLVIDNADPERLGRLRARVPSVLGNDVITGWAMPCAPSGGEAGHGTLFVPAVGAGVWIEFEEGDLEFPIWVGTYWSRPGPNGDLPRPNRPDGSEELTVQSPPTRKIIKTGSGHTLQFEDAAGAELIRIVEAVHGHVITLDANGVKVIDGEHGHEITLSATGITIAHRNGNALIFGPSGIQIGSGGAADALVRGTAFALNVERFLLALNTHTHIGNLGAPTSPVVATIRLDVPLSPKHTVE